MFFLQCKSEPRHSSAHISLRDKNQIQYHGAYQVLQSEPCLSLRFHRMSFYPTTLHSDPTRLFSLLDTYRVPSNVGLGIFYSLYQNIIYTKAPTLSTCLIPILPSVPSINFTSVREHLFPPSPNNAMCPPSVSVESCAASPWHLGHRKPFHLHN